MPRQLGEDGPLRAVRGIGRYTSQPLAGLGIQTTVMRAALRGIGQVEDADADAMANPAIGINLVGVLPVLVCWVNHAFGLMLMLMMPHMLCLSRSAFMHAIASNRRPAELER